MWHHKYISRQEAAVVIGCTIKDVDRFIAIGLLARYRQAGRYIRVLRVQCDELAALDPDFLRGA
jgi:hypothetical protein